jgi:formylglycine-generating enzyme required for sulfatase activity
MGSSDSTTWSPCYPCEQPVHTVDIGYDFYIGKYEVTQAQWETLMGYNPATGYNGLGDNRPVYLITWDEAQSFIDALNGLGQGSFRLPTEAEWEYACRGGTQERYFFGNGGSCYPSNCVSCTLDAYAWWCVNTSYIVHRVGSKMPNPYFLYDVYGHVGEWCEDDWHETYAGAPSDGSAWVDEPRSGDCLIRGGNLMDYPRACRSASRVSGPVGQSFSGVGLRVVRRADAALPTLIPTRTPTHTPTETPTPTPSLEERTFDLPGLPAGARSLEMVRIPAGSFLMGSTEELVWSSCHPCEQPVHEVTVSYDYYIGKFEVTQAQWKSLMGSNPARNYGVGDDYPVYFVSWENAREFLDAINALDMGVFRLPTEAEWEYACRAETLTRFFFGDSNCEPTGCERCILHSYAWWCGSVGYPYEDKEPVGGLLDNPWGLHDVLGNVWELCEDDWHLDYDGAPLDGSVWIDSPRSPYRVIRGGAVNSRARECRPASRNMIRDISGHENVGLRLVRETDERILTFTPTLTPTPTPDHVTVSIPGLPAAARPLTLVRVPAGAFAMGSRENSDWSVCHPCEQPVHAVTIGEDFYLGKYEITQAQWEALMGYNPSIIYGVGDDYPVYYVTWNEVQSFVDALNGLGEGHFRLPTEAEWEYVARGGTTGRFPFPDGTCSATGCSPCALDAYAWWCANAGSLTHPTGGRSPTVLLFHDLFGNVAEWCADDWHPDYSGAPTDGSAWIDEPRSLFRVTRGGGMTDDARECRPASRAPVRDVSAGPVVGFRVVRDAGE